MLFNLLFFVSFAVGYIHCGEIKIFNMIVVMRCSVLGSVHSATVCRQGVRSVAVATLQDCH